MEINQILANELNIKESQVAAAVALMDDGNTIPFIARYRKEATGGLDDQVLRSLSERLAYLRNLAKRKEEVAAAIEGQEKMTEEIAAALAAAGTLAEVEDIYRPYKQKKQTRAGKARARGLEPLALAILEQDPAFDPPAAAEEYITEEVPAAEDALQGARDIIAETISDDAEMRRLLRSLYLAVGVVSAEKAADAKDEKGVYAMYYEFEELLKKIPGHRVLALNRGEAEEVLKVRVGVDEGRALGILERAYVKNDSVSAGHVKVAAEDAFDRLIAPSLEREMRSTLTEQAAEKAIGVFSVNLRQLLMQPPVKGMVTLGLDPAYRTGCKIAVVDETGKVLDTAVVYPTPPQNKIEEAKKKLKQLIKKHGVTLISIGNGTASRESESFVAELIRELDTPVHYVIVSEAGASVYSASKLAAEEFPQFDVSLRSAVSIARRLQDPLAELVKIDPRSIGVGQYQHDMPKARLGEALGGVVEDCVNSVGVDLNTASAPLLTQVAGINASIAKNIVAYREAEGAFRSRKQLLKVPKLGPKAFEQCAGFLRVSGGDNPLDNTAVHPESYPAAEGFLKLCGYTVADLQNGAIRNIGKFTEGQNGKKLAGELGVGLPTLIDIAAFLQKPGRDPRDELPKPILKTDVLELKDLKEGMLLQGTVRNVIDFGAFVDIGVHDDGLVHISQICDRYIKHPGEVLKVGDIVKVKVLSVDLQKHRISLTMKI
ncbi:MAG: RNA-binding transcriptional accessory protein [Clostridia bacterium]|nr:RNA-binding transcriptional accessory protein [Clostridia bacterium]